MIKYKIKADETFYQVMLKFFHEKIIELPLEPILHPSSRRIFLLGLFTLIGHPLFYWLWGYFLPQPYENLGLRITISLLGIILMLPYVNRNPHSFIANISLFSIFFIQMPFFFTWMYLCNSGNAVWLASLSMMVLIWYHITDWRLATVGLILGSAGAWLLFNAIGPETTPLSSELVWTNAIVIAFSFCMAFVLGTPSVNERQLIKELHKEREQALVGLAGSIAHEMRNPLSHIRYAVDDITSSFTGTVNREQVISAEKVNNIYHHLTQISTAVQRGLQVIDITLREVADKPGDPANFAYLSAASVTEKAIEEYSFDSAEDRNKVTLHILNDFTFKADETACIYILFNLIKNALYYFPSHPNATLTMTIDRQIITVRDTGPGIPEHILNTLFNNFSTAGKTNGTGLGLVYCHRTMHAFGGQISCASVAGQSTTFTLRFSPVSQEEMTAHTRQVIQQARPAFHNKRLLIVDDQTIYHALVRQMLDGLGCAIDSAENGQRAIGLLQANHYDLIIMDLDMQAKNGFITTEEIRSGIVPHQKNIAIVAYTAESPYTAKIKTQKAGMDGFISKPCTQADLINVLCTTLNDVEQRKQLEQTENSLAGKTILIVDDECINRQYLERYTREWGLHALHAGSGQAALEIVKKTPHVDIVFMDMEMPLMSGVETTQRLRADPANKDLIILALTGHFSEQSMNEAIASGMNDFITKPFDKTGLRQKLIRLITARDLPLVTAITPPPLPIRQDNPAEKIHINADVMEKRSVTDTGINALTDSPSNRYFPAYQSQKAFFNDLPLIDYAQLTSFQANFNNQFQEFLQRFLSNLLERDESLQTSFTNKDMHAILMALHSLVGFAGYIGAHGLQHYIKLRLYPAVHAGYLPDEEAWVETVHALVVKTVDVLRTDYVSELRETE